jgi:hypothetical protein
MTRKYIEDFCPKCQDKTWHRRFKRMGHRGEKWHVRRTVTWCLSCQRRVIVNATPHHRKRFNKNFK